MLATFRVIKLLKSKFIFTKEMSSCAVGKILRNARCPVKQMGLHVILNKFGKLAIINDHELNHLNLWLQLCFFVPAN